MKKTVVAICCWFLLELVTAATIQQATIAAHNKARRAEATAEHATNLYELVWDAALAKEAQTWADGCVDEHRNQGGHGENLYWHAPKHGADDTYLEAAVQKWMGEKSNDKDGSFDCCFGHTFTCCHYTQVVSARTRRVGCGVATCAELEKNGHVIAHNAAYVVCFYEPRQGSYV